MINLAAGSLQNLLDSIDLTGKTPSVRAGTVIKAEVVDVTGDGNAVLRLIASDTGGNRLLKTLIQATTDIPLTKGQHIFLEVLGDKNDISMRFIGDSQSPSGALPKHFPAALVELLAKLSVSGLESSDHKLLLQMVRALPAHIRAASPEIKNLEHLLLDAKQVNSRQLADSARSILTFTGHADRALQVSSGAIVRARVINITEEGTAVLRLPAHDGDGEHAQGVKIKTDTSIPFIKGQSVFLEVLGGKDAIRMRYIGSQETHAEAARQNIPVNYLDMLSRISEARLDSSDFKLLLNMIKALPGNVKTAIPEFRNLENLLSGTKQPDGRLLRAFVESSGVAYETKLKIAVLSDPGSVFQGLLALQVEGDLKSALLKLRTMLRDQNIVSSFKEAGQKTAEISKMVEKFIQNIEFFQLTSKVNDMFYTYLPLVWDYLRDGELMFKKNRRNKGNSYTCDINLDIEGMGRLSVSVTLLDRGIYVSFHTERPGAGEAIKSHRKMLEERFASQGLILKGFNIVSKGHISFGEAQPQGVDVKI